MTHPMQDIGYDKNGTIRFRENKIVSYLLDNGPLDMNKICIMGFSDEDRNQFAQLIGYSVSGYGDLPYADKKIVKKADKKASKLIEKTKTKTKK